MHFCHNNFDPHLYFLMSSHVLDNDLKTYVVFFKLCFFGGLSPSSQLNTWRLILMNALP